MAFNLLLTEEEAEALRRRAELEGRSMNDVARQAISEYVSDRPARLREAIARVATEDVEVLRRLAQ